MDKTLVVMAAGLGSRYGGVKQIERLGPDGEILMEYAIYDAVAEQSLDIVKYLGLDYQNKLIEACRQCVINGVLHEYLAVGAEALYLLDTAVA